MFEEEDGDAVVGSPRVEQHIPLVKCRFHHKSSQNDQAAAERPGSPAITSNFRIIEQVEKEAIRVPVERFVIPPFAIVEFQTAPAQRCYFSLLLRVSIHGKMMPKRMAKRNDVSQSIVRAP